jgi:ADP-ribose pyrophosphatase YjhB (NUDIX family)
MSSNFNIRVYGILLTKNREIVVSDEYIRGAYITKFPGGGLEFGEGTKDCLRRELMEEMNLRVEVGEHLYTTDYFQRSAFNPSHQIISIYYYIHPIDEINISFKQKPFDFTSEQIADSKGEAEVFRLISLNEFDQHALTLPIDKMVAHIIKQKH